MPRLRDIVCNLKDWSGDVKPARFCVFLLVVAIFWFT
jgi:hypothetical protein